MTMSEQSLNPTTQDPLAQLQRQVEALAVRLGYVEQRLGMAARPSAAAPAAPPRPATPPGINAAPAQPPRMAPGTPPPAFDLPWAQENPARPTPASHPRREAASTAAPLAAISHEPAGAAERQRAPAADTHHSRRVTPAGSGQWEVLIGGKWALWLGSIAVLFALAFFLAYAWQYLGNPGRLAVGTLIGASFLVAGGWSRYRAESWFSEGLTGGGLAILYLSLWAGAQRYHLLSFDAAFTLMGLTTAMGVWLAVRYDAVSLTTLSTLGGFLTPVLLRSSGGSGQSLSFLVYVALLNAGVLGVSLYKRWRGVIWLSFSATLLLMLGWTATSYTEAQRWPVFAFVTVYFLLFVGAACFHSLLHREETASEDLLLLFASAVVYAPAGQGLLHSVMGSYPGIFSLGLALFFALAALTTSRMAPENRTLSAGHGALALLFVTLAIPIQLRQGAVAIAFSLEAACLLTLGLRLKAPLLRGAGQIVWSLSLLSLALVLLVVEPARRLLFLNERALPLLVSVTASAWMAVLAHQWNTSVAESSPNGSRDDLSPFYAVAAVFGGAWLIAQETFLGYRWWDAAGGAWQARATFSTACLWSGYSVAACFAGWRLRMPQVRLCAFLVAAFAAVLPVAAGMGLQSTSWTPFWNLRWLSYLVVGLGLGALLWLTSREREHGAPTDAEALGVLPVAISLLALCGMSVELYAGFSRWGAVSWANWNIAAAFGLATLWSVFALVVLAVGLTWGVRALRILAYLVGGAGAILLLMASLSAAGLSWTPVANLRVLAFGVVLGTLGIVPALLRRQAEQLPAPEQELASSTQLLLLTLALGVWGLTQETYETFRYFQFSLGPQWERAAQMGISLVWTVCGVLLLVAGIVRQQQPVRLLALALCGMTALKVFLFDLGFLSTPFRILSFGGLGLALIGISWLYSRYGIGRDTPIAAGQWTW
jgi:uncharacterized membrane protein